MDKGLHGSSAASNPLRLEGDPAPVVATNRDGASQYLLIGDHAGRAVPGRLGDLGLPLEAFEAHIAWDIGVAGLGERLARALDATFLQQSYSRLVIDCNRRPDAPDSIPETSDGWTIPGNLGLTPVERTQRHDEIYAPYQTAIAEALDARRRRERATLLVSLHSFTPVMGGTARPWRYGVLHRDDSSLSRAMLDLLRREMGEAVGDNQPYALDDKDNTVPLHADSRGLDYLELEVRQDLIADAAGQDAAAELLARLLREIQPPAIS